MTGAGEAPARTFAYLVVSGLAILLATLAVCGRGRPAPRVHHVPDTAAVRGVAWTDHAVWQRSAAGWRRLFAPHGTLLRVIPFTPPQGQPGLLALACDDPRPPQPRRSSLYFVDLAGSARRLSPEAHYNFWDVSAGDVDGDGRPEVALCTYSHTARDPRFARRFFVYGWDEHGDLTPMWRGSRLCRPYVSARLADVVGDARAELVSVETAPDGGQMLVAYEWNQFGFWGLGHSAPVDEVAFVRAAPGSGAVVTVRRGRERREETWRLRQAEWVCVTKSGDGPRNTGGRSALVWRQEGADG